MFAWIEADEAANSPCTFIVNEMNHFWCKCAGIVWVLRGEKFLCERRGRFEVEAIRRRLKQLTLLIVKWEELPNRFSYLSPLILRVLRAIGAWHHSQSNPNPHEDRERISFCWSVFSCLFSECLWFLFAFFLPLATLTSYKTSKHMKHKKLMIIFCDSAQHIAWFIWKLCLMFILRRSVVDCWNEGWTWN